MSLVAPQPFVAPGPDVTLYRDSVSQYDDMVRNGTLTRDDRVELLEGWLVEKTADPVHAAVAEIFAEALRPFADANHCSVRNAHPVVTDDSEPEPDVAVVHGGPRNYVSCHPGPANVLASLMRFLCCSTDAWRAESQYANFCHEILAINANHDT